MTARTTPLALPDGRYAVPGNRWDLLAEVAPSQPPSVSVVVTYFDGQRRLDRMLSLTVPLAALVLAAYVLLG